MKKWGFTFLGKPNESKNRLPTIQNLHYKGWVTNYILGGRMVRQQPSMCPVSTNLQHCPKKIGYSGRVTKSTDPKLNLASRSHWQQIGNNVKQPGFTYCQYCVKPRQRRIQMEVRTDRCIFG